ncbi:BICD family-like cargo adapter 2 [Ornithorhynchus anatinus]|uniref:BICD family-like cargo adapter 2 n=1 Tax=Ornithorhynchus anatinus TaxID=9258 RepID=F6YKV0_ORNAN|nr:BICD family-like cargo adapter 2 [Ornithorhynchus anatinus]
MSSPDGPHFTSELLSGGISPSTDDGFFPFVLERHDSFLGRPAGSPGGSEAEEPEDLAVLLQRKEKDLLLAAELGKMLLERNEELNRTLESLSTQHAEREERLQQENHELRRGLAARGAEWEARAGELEGDVAALQAQLGERRSEQRDSGRERARALGELSEQNLRLSEQLAQASRVEQELQKELSSLRGEHQAQVLVGTELRAQLESLQGENQMLQFRRQDLEGQVRVLREEAEQAQGRVQTLHEELLLLRRERHEHSLELERARAEAGEALSSLRRLQRRVLELEEESRLQDSDTSMASLRSEIARSVDDEGVPHLPDAPRPTPSSETQEVETPPPLSPREEEMEPPKKKASLNPREMLEEKEVEVERLQDELSLQREELRALREELHRQKELWDEEDPESALSGALSDRDEAVNKSLTLSLELSRVSLEKDSLSRELLRAIRQKVALSQELEAWQDDMQVVIGQQLHLQRQKELSAAPAARSTSGRGGTRFSLRRGPGAGGAGGFLTSLFRRT